MEANAFVRSRDDSNVRCRHLTINSKKSFLGEKQRHLVDWSVGL